jgi:hypothetical protein
MTISEGPTAFLSSINSSASVFLVAFPAFLASFFFFTSFSLASSSALLASYSSGVKGIITYSLS